MIRYYYNLYRQGLFVMNGNEHFVIKDPLYKDHPVISYYLDALDLHTDFIKIEIDDHFAPVGETPEVDFNSHPWERVGKYKDTSQLRQLVTEEEWRRVVWREGTSDACHLYFDLLKAEVERHQGCVNVICKGGPADGDIVNMKPCDKRVIVGTAVYERDGDSIPASYDNKDVGHFVREA